MSRAFGPRRAQWIEIDSADEEVASGDTLELLTRLDLIYRSLVSIQFSLGILGARYPLATS
jgi:hypothetical protein